MSSFYGFPPAMRNVREVRVYENGVRILTYVKAENHWTSEKGDTRTNQAIRDFIIASCLNGCTIHKIAGFIEIWFHPRRF